MKNDLTIIIPFLNEGEEIARTVESIRKTAGNKVDILLINDASQDGFDYRSVAKNYGTAYLQNETRKGVAASRDLGVEAINTEYFLLLDGHMRFFSDDWHIRIVEALKQDARSLYCGNCIALDKLGERIANRTSYGAFLVFYDDSPQKLLTPQWKRNDPKPGSTQIEIPCVLGACYAAKKDYWIYLRGLQGLEMYGSDEAYISLKVWLEGGRCILLKDVEIGHIFRKSFPYEVRSTEVLYNKILIMETLFPTDMKDKFYNLWRKRVPLLLRDAMTMYIDHRHEIEQLRIYYQQIQTKDWEYFMNLNTQFIEI